MAHFAELNQNNIVLRVVVIDNKDICDENGNEVESVGIEFCKRLFGVNTRWAQTSYNGNFRKRYAGIGYVYDQARDAFMRQQHYPSWTLDEQLLDWVPPVPYPSDNKQYEWNENSQSWVEFVP